MFEVSETVPFRFISLIFWFFHFIDSIHSIFQSLFIIIVAFRLIFSSNHYFPYPNLLLLSIKVHFFLFRIPLSCGIIGFVSTNFYNFVLILHIGLQIIECIFLNPHFLFVKDWDFVHMMNSYVSFLFAPFEYKLEAMQSASLGLHFLGTMNLSCLLIVIYLD